MISLNPLRKSQNLFFGRSEIGKNGFSAIKEQMIYFWEMQNTFNVSWNLWFSNYPEQLHRLRKKQRKSRWVKHFQWGICGFSVLVSKLYFNLEIYVRKWILLLIWLPGSKCMHEWLETDFLQNIFKYFQAETLLWWSANVPLMMGFLFLYQPNPVPSDFGRWRPTDDLSLITAVTQVRRNHFLFSFFFQAKLQLVILSQKSKKLVS